MNKTMWAVIIVVIVAAAGWYFLSGHASGTVATVNGTPITRSQLTAAELQIAAQQGVTATSTAVQAQFQPDALNLLIGQTLIEQAAQKAGIMASSTVVDAQLAATKAQFSATSDYEKALAARGMTENDLRLAITNNIVINAYLEQQLNLATATATPAEIQAVYKQVAAQQAGTTIQPLSAVRDQVAQMIVQQKQQDSINAYVSQLRAAANVQILIATSTPAT
jgi:SurA N-terminal domain